MAIDEHLSELNKGVDSWNQWRQEYPDVRPDLSGIDLSNKNLSGINLFRAYVCNTNFTSTDLKKSDLSFSVLTESIFIKADLRKAKLGASFLVRAVLEDSNLAGADLGGANLRDANLRNANMRNSELILTSLIGTNLYHTNFVGALMGRTFFEDADLSVAQGLDKVKHKMSSIIDINTFYRSNGNIPYEFLRGAGVPENFIEYMPSLVGQPVQFYSCFISYSNMDNAFVERLHADLQSNGVRCWYAPEDLKIGDKIREQLDNSIRLHEKLLIVLSKTSVASQWVEQEVEIALERERREGRMILFPIRLDNAVMEIKAGWPALLRNTRHIGNFEKWKNHDNYRISFTRLLKDLRANDLKRV